MVSYLDYIEDKIKDITEENTKLEKENAKLKYDNEKLKEENEVLKKMIDKYNSTNLLDTICKLKGL